MNRKTLERAVAEAREFIQRAEVFLPIVEKHGNLAYCDNPRQSGAVTRQSMELTRALADLRAGR